MINGNDFRQSCINSNRNNFEDAKLLTVADAKGEYEEIDLTKGDYEVFGPVVGNFRRENGRYALVAEPSQVLVIGGTGAGKTSCYYQTQLEVFARSNNKPSVFVMDVKGDLYREKSDLMRKNGYEVYVLNFRRPFESSRYNPLGSIYKVYAEATKVEKAISFATGNERVYDGVTYDSYEDWVIAAEQDYYGKMDYCQNELLNIAKIISPIQSTKDPSWDMGSQNIVFGILWGLLEDSVHEEYGMDESKYTLYNLFNTAYMTEDDCEPIIHWAEMHDKESPARNLVAYYDLRAKATRDSYVNNTNNKLNKFSNIPIKALTAKTDVDVEEMAKKVAEQPVAIFCITDETRSVTYDLCLMFINHLLTALQNYADSIGGALKSDFHFLLDEFANMPKLPNVQKWIATLRSRRVWMHLGIQSFEQLDELYGEHGREIIVDNCNVQVFFGCNNVKTTEHYAKSLGQHCVTATSLSFGNSGEISTSFSPSEGLLVRQSDLTALTLGEAYVRSFRHSPLKTVLEPNFLCEDFAHGNASTPCVTRNLEFLEEVFYDIRDTVRTNRDLAIDDDDDPSDYAAVMNAKRIAEKLTDEEIAFLKGFFDEKDIKALNVAFRQRVEEIRPYGKALVEKRLLAVKLGRFSLGVHPSVYSNLRKFVLNGEKPWLDEGRDPHPFRRRPDFF